MQLDFSHDDRFLLSVSRDRHFSIFGVEDGVPFGLICMVKAHERIIWTGGWSHDDTYIATGSRDKKVKLWKKREEKWTLDSSLPVFKQSVTALAWTTSLQPYLLAVGLENGQISFWVQRAQTEWNCLYDVPASLCHVRTVRRLLWKQTQGALEIASCSSDHTVRIFKVVGV